MDATHNMYFGDRLVVIRPHYIHHVFFRQLPSLVSVLVQTGIRTEVAGEHTYVRGFNMEISVEADVHSMQGKVDFIG